MADAKLVTSTDFQNRAGLYLDEAGKAPVVITKHRRPSRVLLDIDEYQRLRSLDTRQALYAQELTEDDLELIASTEYGPRDESLDGVMDEPA